MINDSFTGKNEVEIQRTHSTLSLEYHMVNSAWASSGIDGSASWDVGLGTKKETKTSARQRTGVAVLSKTASSTTWAASLTH